MAAVAVALLAPARLASAHDPFEITTLARASAARLELRTTMAGSTGARVCPGGEPAREACARALYRVTAGGVPLVPRAAAVALTPENELEATVEYLAPAAGPLRIEAAFFGRLPDPTYGAVLTVLADGRLLGQQLLRADEPALEVPVAPASDRPRLARTLPLLAALLVACIVLVRRLARDHA